MFPVPLTLEKASMKSIGRHAISIYAEGYRPWIKEAVSNETLSQAEKTKFGRKSRNFHKRVSVSYSLIPYSKPKI